MGRKGGQTRRLNRAFKAALISLIRNMVDHHHTSLSFSSFFVFSLPGVHKPVSYNASRYITGRKTTQAVQMMLIPLHRLTGTFQRPRSFQSIQTDRKATVKKW